MKNPFKKKQKPPIDTSGFYDWSFRHVAGGFVPLRKLRKPRKAFVFIWFGRWKFIYGFKQWSTKPLNFTENRKPVEYETTVNFDPENFKV